MNLFANLIDSADYWFDFAIPIISNEGMTNRIE